MSNLLLLAYQFFSPISCLSYHYLISHVPSFSLINTYQNFFFSCRLLLNVFCRSRIISFLLYFTISSLKPCLLWLTHQFLSSVCLTFFPLISCLCRSLSISCLSYPSTHFLSLTCHLSSLSLTYNFFSFVTHL